MMKNTAVPMRDCFVETDSSLGTGMKAKISILFKILRQMFGCYYLIKESRLPVSSLFIDSKYLISDIKI